MSLTGRRILLTGASGGIGRALAARLVGAGAVVALTGRRHEALQALTETLPEGRTRVLPARLEAPAAAASLVARAREALGGLDVLINLAGAQDFGSYHELPAEHLERAVALNLLVPMRLAHAALPGMLADGGGQIVNVGSIFGSLAFPGFSAYSASKFGLRGFSEGLRRELADTSVRVSYVAPRATRTAFNDARVEALNRALGVRSDAPDAVAEQILGVLEQAPAERYLGWPERLFARLNAVLPGLVDRDLAKKLALIRRHGDSASPAHTEQSHG